MGAVDQPASLQRRLEDRLGGTDGPSPRPTPVPRPSPTPQPSPDSDGTADGRGISDPVALFRRLEVSGRFHRDTGLGRMFHPGSVSLRENLLTDSLHIVIHDDRIAAHVDQVSPLHLQARRSPRYSLRRAVAHNAAGMTQDLMRLLRGRQGDHRSELSCRWEWDPPAGGPDLRDLLDPAASAWSLHLEARVTGSLDEPRLRRAFAQVLGSRPIDHEVLEVLDCPDDGALNRARTQLQAAPSRLSAWPPLRGRLVHSPGGDVLMLNLNHAASDGFGAVRVLRSIAEAYEGATAPGPPLDFLAVSDLPVGPASPPVSVWKARFRAALENARDLLARPARLAPEHGDHEPDDGPPDEAGYGFHLVRLSAHDTARIVDASRPGRSRNVLLAGLHLAIGDWNLHHGTPGHRIGVLVQVDLRPPEWRQHTVGNFSVTARVATSRRHRTDPVSALRAITAQTTRNRRTRSGIALIAGLDRAGLLPLWARQSLVVLQPLTGNRQVDTAMLSNLGVVDEPPSFGTEAGETADIWFSAPARAPGSLCIGAVTVSGRLHLVVRYPHHVLSADAVHCFTECYLAQLRLLA